ncbi:MAG: cupin domain-containing protein [Rubrivivax sp.]|nr:MAG: cupin domain-containing protein [Rubrivivax sp.]
MSQAVINTSAISGEDVSAFSDELAGGQVIRFEDFTKDVYLDAVIEKPWGHEYRVYADMLIDVWKLMLAPGQSTSMHCHPRKETVLMCLAGSLQINFLTRSIRVEAGQFARIPKGVFHSTDNTGQNEAHLIEVETPRNKFDLVRKKDRYGRQGQQYETGTSPLNIAGMIEDPTNPFSKIRQRDLQGLFSFQIMTGARIRESHRSPDFAVSLSLEAAIEQRIDIFKGEAGYSQLKSDARYLALSHV